MDRIPCRTVGDLLDIDLQEMIYYRILDVFDPQGGVTPHILGATWETPNSVRLSWQGEAGIEYAVESSLDVVTKNWTRVPLPTGNTVTATNALVETSCQGVAGEPTRFYRVVEAQ